MPFHFESDVVEMQFRQRRRDSIDGRVCCQPGLGTSLTRRTETIPEREYSILRLEDVRQRFEERLEFYYQLARIIDSPS